MPQLMPFYWVNSMLMVLFIMMSLLFLFFYKKMEMMGLLLYNDNEDKKYMNFNFLW